MKKQYLIITAVLAAVIAGLIVSMVLVKNEPEPETENNNSLEPDVSDSAINEEKHRFDYIFTCLNSVAGHDERDTIVGNFIGHGLDTLVNSDKLFTPMWLRCSGLEIIEPADKPGYVKIHYSDNPGISDIYDTVEKVTFSRIDD